MTTHSQKKLGKRLWDLTHWDGISLSQLLGRCLKTSEIVNRGHLALSLAFENLILLIMKKKKISWCTCPYSCLEITFHINLFLFSCFIYIILKPLISLSLLASAYVFHSWHDVTGPCQVCGGQLGTFQFLTDHPERWVRHSYLWYHQQRPKREEPWVQYPHDQHHHRTERSHGARSMGRRPHDQVWLGWQSR